MLHWEGYSKFCLLGGSFDSGAADVLPRLVVECLLGWSWQSFLSTKTQGQKPSTVSMPATAVPHLAFGLFSSHAHYKFHAKSFFLSFCLEAQKQTCSFSLQYILYISMLLLYLPFVFLPYGFLFLKCIQLHFMHLQPTIGDNLMDLKGSMCPRRLSFRKRKSRAQRFVSWVTFVDFRFGLKASLYQRGKERAFCLFI